MTLPDEDYMDRFECRLTPEAQAHFDDFKANYDNCSCHTCPPCGSCTHPGHPINLLEDEDAWHYPNNEDTMTYDEVEAIS